MIDKISTPPLVQNLLRSIMTLTRRFLAFSLTPGLGLDDELAELERSIAHEDVREFLEQNPAKWLGQNVSDHDSCVHFDCLEYALLDSLSDPMQSGLEMLVSTCTHWVTR